MSHRSNKRMHLRLAARIKAFNERGSVNSQGMRKPGSQNRKK
jgi:hypothetical protein